MATGKKYLVNFLKFSIFFGTGAGILYLVYRSQNKAYQAKCAIDGIPLEDCSLLQKVISDFAGANYFWVLLVLVAFTISNISRASRWVMLLRPLGYQPKLINGFLTTVLGYFANLGLPRMGEVVRAGTMARYEGIAVEKVMGTIVVDRIIDVISILIVTSLALLLQFDLIWGFVDENISLSERFGGTANLLLSLFGIGILGLGLLYAFRKPLSKTKLYQKVLGIALGFWDGIKTIRKLEKPWLFLLHSINIWFMYYLMTYLCFFAFEPTSHLSALAALVVFVFGGWGIVIPSPGGMGTYHYLTQTALVVYGIDSNDGFSWANISFFSIQIGCNILIGILALVLLPIINRGYELKKKEPEPVAR